jgi:hypothetical protein
MGDDSAVLALCCKIPGQSETEIVSYCMYTHKLTHELHILKGCRHTRIATSYNWLTIPISVFSVKSGFEKKKLKASVLDSTEPLSSPEHV